MKLYDSLRAPNPRRVRWFLAEKGPQAEGHVEIIDVSIFGGEHRQPEYLAKAGLANVPMLEMDDGTGITESVAICRYLESVFPEPNMFGRDPRETAIIEMWARRAEMMLATPLMLTGLAAAVAFRARFYNIGAEGQLYLGALAAVAVGGLHGGSGWALSCGSARVLADLVGGRQPDLDVDLASFVSESLVEKWRRPAEAVEAELETAGA